MKALATAIFEKLSGSLLDSDIGRRLFKGEAPEGAEYPYAVYILVSDVQADTFKSKLEDVIIQFSLFSSNSSTTEIEDMYIHLKTLYDDCSLTLNGSSLVWMVRQSAQLLREEHTTPSGMIGVWHYAVDYSIIVQTG